MKPSPRFHRVKARIATRDRDAFVSLCWEEDTLGVQEFFVPKQLEVQAYFPIERQLAALVETLREKSASLGLEVNQIEAETLEFDPEKWLDEWKDSFTGFPVGNSFFVHPPWKPASPSHRVNIEIEPGHAFGTGTHESTQLCLLALEQLPDSPESLLDVGTGSGILAIAAARLFVHCSVTALDIDPLAAQMAKENVSRNALRRVQVLAAGLDSVTGCFDAVVANLTLPIFQTAAQDLLRLTRRDLIISGFTEDQGPEIRALFSSLHAQLQAQWTLRGWLCFRLTAP